MNNILIAGALAGVIIGLAGLLYVVVKTIDEAIAELFDIGGLDEEDLPQ